MSSYRPVHKAIPNRPLRSLWRYARPYWRQYLGGATLALLFVAMGMVLPLVVSGLVADFGQGVMTSKRLWFYFVALILMAVGTGLARYFQRTLMIGASRFCEYDLRNDFFRHLQCLSQRFFHHTPTGDLMARTTNDLNYVRDFLGPGMMGTVDMLRLPFTLGLMIYYSPHMTLTALIPLPVVSLSVYFLIRYINRQSKRVQEDYAKLSSRTQENLAGARVVKAFGIADREEKAFEALSRRYMRSNIKLMVLMSFAMPLIGMLVGGTILLILWRGGGMVIRGELGFDDLSGFLVCMVMLAWPLAQLGWILTLYQRGMVSMKRIGGILDQTPDIYDDVQSEANARIREGAIRFDSVSFSYPPADLKGEAVGKALDSVSFSIQPGQTVAIVGPTGSGKSTLISLLGRAYDVDEGIIYLDDQPIRSIPLAQLRAAIAYVPQDPFIFSDTIRMNIALGAPNASLQAIEEVCRIAQFSQSLQGMEEGLETLLGERGINLSGGQKQRLTLARALLCEPRILILDDALSSVDTHTEEEILRGLKAFSENRSTLLISHRISTVRHADLILVLEAGRIVEQGRHEELIAQQGLYAGMYARQLLEEAVEDMA